MTLVVALEGESFAPGRVWVAADRAVTRGDVCEPLPAAGKIVRKGPVVLASAGALRAVQVLREHLPDPKPRRGESPERFLNRGIVEPLRRALAKHGLVRDAGEGDEADLVTVLGYAGRAWALSSDFSLMPSAYGYVALGVGEDIARGVLHHRRHDLAPRKRLDAAFGVVSELVPGVAGLDVVSLPPIRPTGRPRGGAATR